jgi:hypothetical protein
MSGHRWVHAALAATIIGVLASPAQAAAPVGGFGPAQKVTPFQGYGYEPAVLVDNYNNIYVTAHKENWQLALAPDVNSPTYTRSMSWIWASFDGGLTFPDLPGWTGVSIEQHEFGDEGDFALDDAGHLYFVDTNVADDTIARWSTHGPGALTFDFTRPLIPAAQLVDDRPWITAHGDGKVFYFGNEGDKVTYPLGQGSGTGFGPGRYTVYRSLDGGQSFDSLGYTLADSGWCRPAADHAAGSKNLYAFCTNDGGSDDVSSDTNSVGTLWAYASSDDGQTFSRYKAGEYKALDSTTSWPTVSVVGGRLALGALRRRHGTRRRQLPDRQPPAPVPFHQPRRELDRAGHHLARRPLRVRVARGFARRQEARPGRLLQARRGLGLARVRRHLETRTGPHPGVAGRKQPRDERRRTRGSRRPHGQRVRSRRSVRRGVDAARVRRRRRRRGRSRDRARHLFRALEVDPGKMRTGGICEGPARSSCARLKRSSGGHDGL